MNRKVEILKAQLLADRARFQTAGPSVRRERAPGSDFDPFDITRWVVIAGGDPGYLPKTPMRKGPVGFYVACRGCGSRFESKGMAYCARCLALPAEERHALRPGGRLCLAPGCSNVIAPTARADARYCSTACRVRARREGQGAVSRNEIGCRPPDIGPPENVTDSAEKTQQNQGPKIDPQKTEGNSTFDRLREGKPLSDWKPSGGGQDIPDIPGFLRR
jgi:hypothetical protein